MPKERIIKIQVGAQEYSVSSDDFWKRETALKWGQEYLEDKIKSNEIIPILERYEYNLKFYHHEVYKLCCIADIWPDFCLNPKNKNLILEFTQLNSSFGQGLEVPFEIWFKENRAEIIEAVRKKISSKNKPENETEVAVEEKELRLELEEARKHLLYVNSAIVDHLIKEHQGRPHSTCHRCLNYNIVRQATLAAISDVEKEIENLI